MDTAFFRQTIRALALAIVTLTTLAAGGCGGGDGSGPSGPPSDPSDPADPGQTPEGPAPVGDVMYAVDLANNFIVFGTGSIETPTAVMKITGLPILKRIIGLAIRPSDQALIGVGNDSRVYTIDPLTAEATPVSDGPFSPQIASFFDIHFAMALEPDGQHMRLIAAESGGNWSIDINDGSATLGPNALYGAGSELEGQTPALLGIVYPTLPDSAKQSGWCRNLAYGMDADEAVIVASCDPASGWWYPVGLSPEPSAAVRPSLARIQLASTGGVPKALEDLKDQLLRCGEFQDSPGGSSSGGEKEPPQDGGPWFPHSPDTKFYTIVSELGEHANRSGTVEQTEGGIWSVILGAALPTQKEVQSGVWAVGGAYGPSKSAVSAGRDRLHLSAARGVMPSASMASGDATPKCSGA
jgi:hypothetical protein